MQHSRILILQLFKAETTTPLILHKSTSIISTFIKIKQKQEWEIKNELKDWELGVAVSTFKHHKKFFTPVAFLDSW
jgi:hypothetical protein